MENLLLKSISPQSIKVYNSLIKDGPLSATQVGKKVNILPNTAYRNLKELISLGFVGKSDGYPAIYCAKPKAEAVGLYTNIIVQNFQQVFAARDEEVEQPLKISFFLNRKDLLNHAGKDAHKASRQIDRIVSGDAIPAETTLAFKQAVERGVKVRILVQGVNNGKTERIESWLRMGMAVKYTPHIYTRIVVYDSLVVYFASYDPEAASEAVGVRFEYPPLAALIDDVFEQRWKLGKAINK